MHCNDTITISSGLVQKDLIKRNVEMSIQDQREGDTLAPLNTAEAGLRDELRVGGDGLHVLCVHN